MIAEPELVVTFVVGGDLYRHVDLWSGSVLPDDGSCRVYTTRFVFSGTLVRITTESTFTIVCWPLILQKRSQCNCKFMRFILSVYHLFAVFCPLFLNIFVMWIVSQICQQVFLSYAISAHVTHQKHLFLLICMQHKIRIISISQQK